MKITVIIPVINLWKEYTRPCIESLRKQILPDGYELNIHIIDNGSTDETKEIIDSRFCKIIRYEENIGVAKSWNLGIENALNEGADYVLVINNDTIFGRCCVQELIDRFQKNDLVLISPINTTDENIESIINNVQELNDGDYSAFLIDERLFELVGEFDENFSPAYFEDNDMNYRIKLAKLKSIKYCNAFFHHFGSKTQNQKPGGIVNSQLFEKNRDYYIKKWGGVPGQERYKTPFNN